MPAPRERGPYLFCPKTGRFIGCKPGFEYLRWTFPAIGFAALVWYLIRVLPKPDRADYPCQRVAFPLAWGFLASLTGWIAAVVAARRAGDFLWQGRRALAALFFIGAIAGALIGFHSGSDPADAALYVPPDPPNTPMGVAKGIHPGRVVWAYDPSATPWDGVNGRWWDDTNTIQSAVDGMFSLSVRKLAGQSSDADAWDALFHHFNTTRGRGTNGYLAGEKIAIKINCNTTTNYWDSDSQVDASPQSVLALLRQLVIEAGVPESEITVYEATKTGNGTRVIANRIYDKGHAEFPSVNWVDCTGTNGRIKAAWRNNVIYYAVTNQFAITNQCSANLPTCLYEADYVINLALMKCHGTAGFTLTAKNHYGSLERRDHLYINVKDKTMPLYSPLVDLVGHEHIGGKTLLFLVDALYAATSPGSPDGSGAVPARFNLPPFNGRWPSSLFASQDPVAIDSVGLDFLNSEFSHLSSVKLLNSDNYLHEAALAPACPSGTTYDPENDGTPLTSLGVHEHWNDPILRQYSRNLGTSDGIELVYASPIPFRMDGARDSEGYRVGERNGMPLYASLAGGRLYVATAAAGDTGGPNDHFVFVTTNPASLRSPPWSKSGQIAFDPATQPYLADESQNTNDVIRNAGAYPMWSAATTTSGLLECSFDLREVFGTIPDTLYIAAAPYLTANGGTLVAASQVPGGDGDGNIEAEEFLAVPTGAIRDDDLDGTFDCQDPNCGFVARATCTNGNAVALTWPTIPRRRYQPEWSTNLVDFYPLGDPVEADPSEFRLSCDDPSSPTHRSRFYRIRSLE